MPLPKQVRPHTVGTKEVVLRGGPPSVDGGQSILENYSTYNTKIGGPTCENHQFLFQKLATPGNHQVIIKRRYIKIV